MCLRICACKCIWCQFLVIRRVSGIDVSVSVSVSIAVYVSIFVSVSSSLVDYQWYLVSSAQNLVSRIQYLVSGIWTRFLLGHIMQRILQESASRAD